MVRLSGVRLTDVLGAMSLAVDLGLGQPMGHVTRSCLLADRLETGWGYRPRTENSSTTSH